MSWTLTIWSYLGLEPGAVTSRRPLAAEWIIERWVSYGDARILARECSGSIKINQMLLTFLNESHVFVR